MVPVVLDQCCGIDITSLVGYDQGHPPKKLGVPFLLSYTITRGKSKMPPLALLFPPCLSPFLPAMPRVMKRLRGTSATTGGRMELLMTFNADGAQILVVLVPHTLVSFVVNLDGWSSTAVDAYSACIVKHLSPNVLPLGTCKIIGVLPPPFLGPFRVDQISNGL